MGIVAWFRSLSPKQLLNRFKNISNAAKDAPPESLIFATILAWAKLSRDQKFSLMFGWSIKVSPSKIQDIFEPTSCEITWNHYNSPRIHGVFLPFWHSTIYSGGTCWVSPWAASSSFHWDIPPKKLPQRGHLGEERWSSSRCSKEKMATLSQVMISNCCWCFSNPTKHLECMENLKITIDWVWPPPSGKWRFIGIPY